MEKNRKLKITLKCIRSRRASHLQTSKAIQRRPLLKSKTERIPLARKRKKLIAYKSVMTFRTNI